MKIDRRNFGFRRIIEKKHRNEKCDAFLIKLLLTPLQASSLLNSFEKNSQTSAMNALKASKKTSSEKFMVKTPFKIVLYKIIILLFGRICNIISAFLLIFSVELPSKLKICPNFSTFAKKSVVTRKAFVTLQKPTSLLFSSFFLTMAIGVD